MLKKLKPTIVLTAICLIVAALLSVINLFTAPVIKSRQDALANAALTEVLPGASGFESITIDDSYPDAIVEGYKADKGYVFKTSVKSYEGAELIVMIGVDNEGKITATKKIADGDTDTRDVNVFPYVQGEKGAYNGMTLDTFTPFLATGATITSNSYANSVKAALQAFAIAGGAEVDLRTPEEILQDDCNAALGTEGKTFVKWFATEVLTGVDAVYESEDGTVFKLGDKLVGYKDGEVISETTDEERDTVEAAYALVSGSTLTDVEKPEGASANVLTVQVTASGNYVFTARGAGYDRNNEYSQTKEYIYIKLAISADGRIIDVVTTSHHESEGFGDKCDDPDFYAQLIGKDSTNHAEVVISGATKTTEGYQRALKQCFAAFDLLTANNSTEGDE